MFQLGWKNESLWLLAATIYKPCVLCNTKSLLEVAYFLLLILSWEYENHEETSQGARRD